MKILSITIHRVVNFGSVLQAYATQELFKSRGVDFATLDYIPERLTLSFRLKEIFLTDKRPLYQRLAQFLTMEVINRSVFDGFLKRRLRVTLPFRDKDKPHRKVSADVYMTGSDQVWNSEHNRRVDTTYYWDFVKGRKVAFASSFGRTEIPESEAATVRPCLADYSLLSAREDTGVAILNRLQKGQTAVQLLDPTLLLDGNRWRSIARRRGEDGRRRYVLIYPMSSVDPTLIEVGRKIAIKAHAELWMLSPGLKTFRACDRTLKFQSPERFLALVDGAECLVTNSFHGTVFAVNFNRPFVSVPPVRYSTRITSVLRLLGLESRLYTDAFDLDNSLVVDFTEANKILAEERAKADTYINKILSLC